MTPFRPLFPRSAAAVLAVLLLPGCAALGDRISSMLGGTGDTAVVAGTMVLSDGTVPPATARAEARIVDLSRSGPETGDFLVAAAVVDTGLTPPIPFRMTWRPGTLDPAHEYVVTGRISGRSGRLYETAEPVVVRPGDDRQQVTLTLVPVPGAAEAEREALRGEYSLEGVPDVTATSDMPMTMQGDLESLYDDRPGYGGGTGYGTGGDGFLDYMRDRPAGAMPSAGVPDSRVIAPQ